MDNEFVNTIDTGESWKLDYDMKSGIWDYGSCPPKFVENYYRLRIFTPRIREFILEKTGKNIPLGKSVMMKENEFKDLRNEIEKERRFSGLFGSDDPKDYDWWKHFYEDVDYPITDELETYDLKYNEL